MSTVATAAADVAVDAPDQPGIYRDIPNDVYHAGPGVSKSGLWTIYTKTPAHFRFEERETTKALDLGSAIDLAILDPNGFEDQVMRGPADRRGNKWADAQNEANHYRRLLLTAGDYDKALRIRDGVHADPWINSIITEGEPIRQASAYWIDPETGILCRCRPDLVRADIGIMLDLKSCRDASPRGFGRAVAEYGYHAQEAWYVPGWQMAGGCAIDGMVFLAVETGGEPYPSAVYELKPSAVAEGAAAMRAALETYARCSQADQWPAYENDVQELDIPRWGYKLTQPAADEDVAAY